MPDALALFGGAGPRREAVEVAEPKRQDKRLPKLINVHKRRLERMERECIAARNQWRSQRITIGEIKRQWRDAKQEAIDFWMQSRAEFFRMEITSGKFRTAKAVYERKKLDAEKIHLQAREAAIAARNAGHHYFDCKQLLRAAHLRGEKLTILQKITHDKANPFE
jgi:hypothetical protein